ncbi:hypothetical protein DY000_02039158 [Brassica cretica]|uniref:TIR domain-containing protein n=1 Tax=Brassica cretica TaxID=69181 RepID=A0ABQ7BL39_BRACR|nr:hypothetical protein DY000_02039158 [Brassica cretica]
MWMNRVDILDLSLRKPVWGRSVEDVEKWKRALDEVSNIFGYRSKGLIPLMVVQKKKKDSVDDVRMVGIWGPAGIGKTTIARALHRKLSSNFTHSAFMESTRGSRETHHPFILKQYFNVLLVLDDVYDSRQLKAMADETQSFRYGSRIIITTNDKKLLKAHGINHVNFPCSSEALEIFCLSAFDQKSPYVGFEELAKEITGFAGNLPLGLNVYGSYLRGMSKGEWIQAFPRLGTSLHTNIEKVIRRDYETLCNKNKDLFLHIACFFKGEKTSNLGDYFSNLDIRRGLQVLVEKSLIFKDNNGARLVMHNLLEQLGIEISRKEYIDENGRRAREICDVLNDDRGSGSVRGTDHVLTAIKDDISIGERAYERTIDALPTLSLLPSSSTHQIFISFREADVRDSFLSHMLMVLRNKGITPFADNNIEKDMREMSQTVIPIFYEVEPPDVKTQIGSLGSIFEEDRVWRPVGDVEKWKQALYEVVSISGYYSRDWKNEAEMMEKVANDVLNKLNMAAPSRDFDGLVGMENHITQISSMLSLDSNDVRMVGILGPAGIGKTTIARALYNKLSNSFTHTAFMESIRGSGEKIHSDDYAFMLHLQEQLLCQTFNHKDLKIHHLGVAEERLKYKKVLLVLDDVDDIKQLKAMARERLSAYEIFCLYAFGQKFPYDGYEDLAMEVTGLAGDLPLGLRVFGSYLRGMSKEEWIEALPRLRTSLDGDIEKVLRFSYEALCDNAKDLFLYIACLFEGESISYLEKCLAHSDLEVKHGLRVLANNSLISITDEHLVMHNLVEQLGKEIIRQEHKDEPERRKFLVDAREICDVLTDNTGSGSVLGIDLDIMAIKDELCIDKRAFEGMTRLQFLRFKSPYSSGKNNKLILPLDLNNLPRKLRVLRWDEFPLRCLPPDFAAEFLVILEIAE